MSKNQIFVLFKNKHIGIVVDILITALTGTPLFKIFICDISGSPCFEVSPVGGIPSPPPNFQFTVPDGLSASTSYLLSILDSRNCEVFEEIIPVIPGASTLWRHIPRDQLRPLPTPTNTPTQTNTPTPSVSVGYVAPTPTNTPTNTTTPSITPSLTISVTPSRSVGSGYVIYVYYPNL